MLEEASLYDSQFVSSRASHTPRTFDDQLQRHWHWSEQFYLLPAAVAVFLTVFSAVLIRFSNCRDSRALVLVWGGGWTAGFVIWTLAWFGIGPGTGQVNAAFAVLTMLGWIFWHAGLFAATFAGGKQPGGVLCLFVAVILAAIRLAVPRGTAFIELALLGALGSLPCYVYTVWHAKERTPARRPGPAVGDVVGTMMLTDIARQPAEAAVCEVK